MISLQSKVSKHVNDIIQKYASGLFRNATLEVYGIKTAPIKELINPELPTVEVSGGAADMVFLLEDDTYLHLAFVTGHNSKEAMLNCVGYDARLYKRDKRLTHTVMIYTADVKKKPALLNIGTLTYDPSVVLMANYNGNTTFTELETKIKAGNDLSDTDILKLVLLPLMNHTLPWHDLATNTIELAKKIPDKQKKNACIAAAFGFASKYLDDEKLNNLREVLEMTELVESFMMDEKIETIKVALKEGLPIASIARITRLEESKIKELMKEFGIEY